MNFDNRRMRCLAKIKMAHVFIYNKQYFNNLESLYIEHNAEIDASTTSFRASQFDMLHVLRRI